MKAMQITEFGGPEVMKYTDVADPTPGEGEAVVEIQAAGVNFTDVYSRQGVNPGPPLPRIIGVEGAGVVKAIGPGVTEVKVGDDVTGVYDEQKVLIGQPIDQHIIDEGAGWCSQDRILSLSHLKTRRVVGRNPLDSG